jgi:nucleoside-diphosphate-sugar epimerase
MSTASTILITGGAGFLGRALIHELRRPGALLSPAALRVLDTRPDPFAPGEGVTYHRGDVRSAEDVRRAAAGADVVFHLAALIDWGQHPADRVHAVNVGGTRAVVEACRAAGVRALVHVSSLDAVYGGQPLHAIDETQPYPERFPTAYCASKAAAEQVALAASGAGLAVTVVRMCSIWGEGDPYHLGAFLALARRGPVVRLGRGPAPTQGVYVRNGAYLLGLAARALLAEAPGVAGEVFFATDFAPRSFFDLLEPFVRAAGGRMVPRALALPRLPVKVLAHVLTLAARVLRPVHAFTPLFTPFSVDYVCQEFTVVTDKAARVLGYAPPYSEAEAVARTAESVRGCLRA